MSLWVVGLVGCGSAVPSGGPQASAGASTSSATDDRVSSSDPTDEPGGSNGSAETIGSATGQTSAADTTAAEPIHCQVEVLESVQLSPERFGALTLPDGHPDVVVLGSTGWTLAGTIEAPVVERFLEPQEEMLAGQFGPGGAWAYAHLNRDGVDILPLDDPDTAWPTTLDNHTPVLVGNMDQDDLDDLITSRDGVVGLWRADGAGGFELLAESPESYPDAIRGYAAATDWPPPAILIAQAPKESGILGLELTDDVLEKAYAVDVFNSVSMQGVTPAGRAGRAILVATYGGILIDPTRGRVGFVEGQDGTWTGRDIEFPESVETEPRALDLDGDGVLDAVFATAGDDPRLVGACSQGDELLPCLEVPLPGEAESLAVDADGRVFVATLRNGLWHHQLGPCQ